MPRRSQERGYHVLVFMADNDAAQTAQVVDEMLDYQVDGIVAASVAIGTDLAARCEAAGIPVVLFNRGQDGSRHSEVTTRQRRGRARGGALPGRRAGTGGSPTSRAGRAPPRGATGRAGFRGARRCGLEPVAVVDGLLQARGGGGGGARADRAARRRPTRSSWATTTWPSA